MLSYMSLLVLVLATSAVSPVRAANPLKIEGTSHSEPSERPRFKITRGKVLAGLGSLAFVGLIYANLVGGPPSHFNNNNTTNKTQPTSTTQQTPPPPISPPQPTPIIPSRAFAGREVRIPGRRGLSVDTSNGVADSVVTTVGHSEARLFSDNNDQKMQISSPDLLNRAHLGEVLRLFGRMLDELD
ncbi:hypothetical protein V8E52_011757 [Russula decolorans]